MILSDEKQDINSDFNHVKHMLKGKDQRSIVITAELLTGLCAFLWRWEKIPHFRQLKAMGNKRGPFFPSIFGANAFSFWNSEGSSQLLTPSAVQISGSARLKMLYVILATHFQASTRPHPQLLQGASRNIGQRGKIPQ